MSSVRYPKKEPCWILWELHDGKMYLRTITTSEALVIGYKRALIKEAKKFDLPLISLHIEKSELNHLYGRRER